MSDANMVAIGTKQLIISLVIVSVMLATADQVGRNFLLSSLNTRIDAVESGLNARIDSVEARIDAVERNFNARIDSVQSSLNARMDSLGSSLNARIDSLEKNFEARFVRIDEDMRELGRGQEALNQGFSALTERVARIEGFLFDSGEKTARAEQVPLKSEADGVQIAP